MIDHRKFLLLVVNVACLVAAGVIIGCASVNVKMERLTRDAIAASEDMRCTLHPTPCLSDAQFKAVNIELYNVAVVGGELTKLSRAGSVAPNDYVRLVQAVEKAINALATQSFPAGTIGKILGTLQELDAKARQLSGGT